MVRGPFMHGPSALSLGPQKIGRFKIAGAVVINPPCSSKASPCRHMQWNEVLLLTARVAVEAPWRLGPVNQASPSLIG